MIHRLGELGKKFHMFLNSFDYKFWCTVEWDLLRVSNLIQRINDYSVNKKTWFNIVDTLQLLCLNQKIVNE
jgi:hypothetical protein